MSNYIFPDGRYGDVLQAVYNEINRAKAKHGDKDFNSSHEGYAVMAEEVDEMWDEVKCDNHDAAVEEAIQVAAMAVRFAAELGKYPYKKVIKPDFKSNAIEAYKFLHPAATTESIKRFEEELNKQHA